MTTKRRNRGKKPPLPCSHGPVGRSGIQHKDIAQRRGYTITNSKGLWGARLLQFDTLGSTNEWVMANSTRCRHGDVIVANSQTQGRGRFERPWLAMPGKSLALSVYLDPAHIPHDQLSALGPCAALAVRRTLARRGIPAGLKWPNDVVVNKRKISGILLEQSSQVIVLGIGINLALTQRDLESAGLGKIATSVLLQSGISPQPTSFRRQLLIELALLLRSSSTDARNAMCEWRDHDVLTNRVITVTAVTGSLQGGYKGITDDWRLIMTSRDGNTHILSAGDVTLSRKQA